MAVKKVGETVVDPGLKYWKIQSNDWLFMEVALGLIMFPGTYAYITEEQKESLPEYSLAMLTISEITPEEYQAKIGQQGLMGLG